MRRQTPAEVDPVLGRVRECPSCREWWPEDPEFFQIREYQAGTVATTRGRSYVRSTSGVTYRCWACVLGPERLPRLIVQRGARMVGHCQTQGCMVMVPDGRVQCHGCAGRTAGPLTAERIAGLLRSWEAAA